MYLEREHDEFDFFFETKTEFNQQNNYDFLLDLSEN
jgi:hypothetical protein